MKKLIAAITLAFTLAGCKTEVDIPLTYTELSSPEATKMVELLVEIPGCQDYKSKLDSNSLLEAKMKVPFVIEGAQYQTCRRVRFDSFAVFTIPVRIGVGNGDDKGIQVYPSRIGSLVVYVGKDIRDKAKQVSGSGQNFDASDLEINVIVTNDSGKDLEPYVMSAFAWYEKGEKIPVHDTTVNFKAGDTIGFTQSNVGAVTGIEDGISPIIRFKELATPTAPADPSQ